MRKGFNTTMIALQTEAGPAYVTLERIEMISSPFTKKGHDQARCVGLFGGHKVFILDNEHNRQKLESLLPADAKFLAATVAPAKAGGALGARTRATTPKRLRGRPTTAPAPPTTTDAPQPKPDVSL
jgi:hypothetical protein